MCVRINFHLKKATSEATKMCYLQNYTQMYIIWNLYCLISSQVEQCTYTYDYYFSMEIAKDIQIFLVWNICFAYCEISNILTISFYTLDISVFRNDWLYINTIHCKIY